MVTNTNALLQQLPVPIALLDTELRFTGCSKQWRKHFNFPKCPQGYDFRELMPELPEELWLDFQYCLEGVDHRSDSVRFIDCTGNAVWYEWKVNSWKDENGLVLGLAVVFENISCQKRNESLVEKSMEVAKIGGWEVDLIKNTIYWSRITREIHEVDDDFEPNLEAGINFYKEGYSRDAITRCVQDAIEHGTPWDIELQIVTTSGKEVWVRAKGEAEVAYGKCVRLNGTFQDIDERKKAEMKYRKVSERLALATKAAGMGIWEYVVPSNELYWDKNMYDVYGVREEDFSGCYEAWETCVIPEDKKESSEKVSQAIAEGKGLDMTFRIRWPNDEIRWIKADATVIKNEDGEVERMIGINTDITELKTMQLQLQQSEESLQGAFENSSVGMALVGLDGRFMQVNDSLCDSIGYSREQLLALTFQEITHPEDLNTDIHLFREVITGKRDTYQLEKRYFHENGKVIHVFLTVTAVKKIDGELSHFISQIVDISSRIEAEQKLQGLFDLTQQQNKSLLNFAHIVSHNMRSHASNLSMITHFLLNDKIEHKEREDAIGMLHKASNGLNETIEHLNEVVQVKLETQQELKSINLRRTAEKVLQDLQAIVDQSNTQIKMDIPKSRKILGVPAYVESILLNLITNAIKYRQPEKANVIELSCSETDKHLVLAVKDNGLGIDLDRYGKKIFGMYKTFHRNEDAKGIGLFITRNQIESMGGSIQVESQVNQGTTFTVNFQKANYESA